ncbi:MAG: hypothetical protein AB8C02_04775 [Halioglobus sp.]
MNWDAVGAIAEVLGATAVLVTLIYFSLQIRQSNKLAEAESQRELMNFDVFTPMVEDPNLTSEFRACLNRYEEQDPDVKTRFFFLMTNWHLQMESVFRMNEKGLIAELSYKGYLTWYNSLLNTPGGAAFWKEVSPAHAPDLVQALEDLKSDPENPYRYASAFELMPFLKEESSAP